MRPCRRRSRVGLAPGGPGGEGPVVGGPVAEQAGLGFGGLLRRLRDDAGLTQDELAEAAGVSQRAISDLERGINRTARKDTALLLAAALGLAGPARDLFVTVARGQPPAAELLAVARAEAPGGVAGHQAGLAWLLRAVVDSPYRGLAAFEEQDAGFFSAAKRPPPRCWSGWTGNWTVQGWSWCPALRARASRRYCALACCRASGGPGLRRCQGHSLGRACCSPRRIPRWTSWRCGRRCWRAWTQRRSGEDWAPGRRGSPSPRAKPPWASADTDGAMQLWDVSLIANPYAALCTDVGSPTRQGWDQYAPGEPPPKICA
jgi:transcriptional regulator with XRE-family HTH domain